MRQTPQKLGFLEEQTALIGLFDRAHLFGREELFERPYGMVSHAHDTVHRPHPASTNHGQHAIIGERPRDNAVVR